MTQSKFVDLQMLPFKVTQPRCIFALQFSVKMTLLSAKSKGALSATIRTFVMPVAFQTCKIRSVIAAFVSEISVQSVTGWTDSEIWYYWITHVQKDWKTWLENRVNQIQDIIPIHHHHHHQIPGGTLLVLTTQQT